MKKKFGSYVVNFKKVGKPVKRIDGLYQTEAVITGDVEIGIEMETMSWREDWLKEATFGKEDAKNWRLVNVLNDMDSYDYNKITAAWRKL